MAVQADGPSGLRERISDAMVEMYASEYGMGATTGITYVTGPVVLCLISDSATTNEDDQIANGLGDLAIDGRLSFQRDKEDAFTQMIERLTERKVVAFLSANETSLAHAAEIFILDSPPDGEVHEEG